LAGAAGGDDVNVARGDYGQLQRMPSASSSSKKAHVEAAGQQFSLSTSVPEALAQPPGRSSSAAATCSVHKRQRDQTYVESILEIGRLQEQ